MDKLEIFVGNLEFFTDLHYLLQQISPNYIIIVPTCSTQ